MQFGSIVGCIWASSGAHFLLIIAKKFLNLKNNWSLLLAIAWFVVTTILLTLPGSAFPKENWFDKIWLDKWIHIALFGMLAFLWCRAAPTESLRKIPLF